MNADFLFLSARICVPKPARAREHLRQGMGVVELQRMLGCYDLATTHQYLPALNDNDVTMQALRASPVEHGSRL